MPFKKVKPTKAHPDAKYKGPSGRRFNEAQVKLYYANGGKFPGKKRK